MVEQKRSEIDILARRNAALSEKVATLTGELATTRESLRSRDEWLATQSKELAALRGIANQERRAYEEGGE